MCSGSKSKVLTAKEVMESEDYKKDSIGDQQKSVLLLELSATNDLTSFKDAVEKEGYDVDEAGLWYGRRVGSKKMGFEERTPLMVAAMFGSKEILNYILQTGCVDVNRASGSDGATALHCAAAGGSLYSHEVIKLLVESSSDVDRVDVNGNRPCDVIAPCFSFSSKLKRRTLDILLNKGDQGEDACGDQIEEGQQQQQLEGLSPKSSSDGSGSERKEYPIDPSLPDIKNGIYGTDEFRMYTFKVKPCSRAYSHDWTECPFVHPGENARRRDPRKYHYSCVPCPEFRKGSCPKGDACEYAHGIFECWLHPAQYRTRLCKDETNCARRVCFFAHKPEELRPLYASTGSAVPSPRSYSSSGPSFDMASLSPLALGSPPVMMPSTSTPPMTPTGASSPIGGAAAWQNHLNITPPPALQLPGSRLKAALSARDMDMESGLRRQQLLDELSGLSLSSPSNWNGEMGRLGGFSLSSPTGVQMRQPKCHGMNGVCWLHGISVINGKISIVMKFYEGSIGDKMARSKGGKLSLPDVLRYGINLAQAIMEVHSQEILVLNLKPSNLLLDENDQAILGDFGVPYLLMGLSLSNSDMSLTVGSPNYMAPEQWEPEIRGPVSFESDSWGYGCTILEMLTGDQPWCGMSVQQIYRSVVLNQEKPQIPSGLPPEIENVISGCFESDFQNRPLMTDIMQALKSSHDAIMNDETTFILRSKPNRGSSGRPYQQYYTEWFLSKDTLQEGDIVRSRKEPNSSKSENMLVPEGKVVGLEGSDDRDGSVLVRVRGIHDPLRVRTSTLERVSHGFAAGDWVRLREEQKQHSPVGILHSIHRDGTASVAFIGLETLWKGNHSELQMAKPYHVGQFVRLKVNLFNPRFEWPRKRGAWDTGKILHIHPNGCLIVDFPGRLPFVQKQDRFLADPAEVEVVSFSSCQGVLKKYQLLEDIHWAVRPLLVALGLFTAMKVGLLVGKKITKPKMKREKLQGTTTEKDDQLADNSGNSQPGFPLLWPQ